MEGLQLIATGGVLPGRVVTNEDLSQLVDTSDEWITTRTGIRQRHFCAEGETAATLAVSAARQALEGVPKGYDIVFVARAATPAAKSQEIYAVMKKQLDKLLLPKG